MCPKHIQKTYRFGSFSTIGGLPVKMVPTSTNFFLIIYSNSQKHSHVLSNWKKWHCSDSALFLRSLYAYVDERIHGVHAMIRAQSKQYIPRFCSQRFFASLHRYPKIKRYRIPRIIWNSKCTGLGNIQYESWSIRETCIYIYIQYIVYIYSYNQNTRPWRNSSCFFQLTQNCTVPSPPSAPFLPHWSLRSGALWGFQIKPPLTKNTMSRERDVI